MKTTKNKQSSTQADLNNLFLAIQRNYKKLKQILPSFIIISSTELKKIETDSAFLHHHQFNRTTKTEQTMYSATAHLESRNNMSVTIISRDEFIATTDLNKCVLLEDCLAFGETALRDELIEAYGEVFESRLEGKKITHVVQLTPDHPDFVNEFNYCVKTQRIKAPTRPDGYFEVNGEPFTYYAIGHITLILENDESDDEDDEDEETCI
jgi:hypothetical protein